MKAALTSVGMTTGKGAPYTVYIAIANTVHAQMIVWAQIADLCLIITILPPMGRDGTPHVGKKLARFCVNHSVGAISRNAIGSPNGSRNPV